MLTYYTKYLLRKSKHKYLRGLLVGMLGVSGIGLRSEFRNDYFVLFLSFLSYWHRCSYFSEFIPEFNGAILSVVHDVPVDNEVPVVTSSISRFAGPT